jgi:molybdate transport system substrate-binding protein
MRRENLALCFAFAALVAPFSTACWAQPARAKLADAAPGDVRLFVSGALRAPMVAVLPQLEQATGKKVLMEVSESRILQSELEAGQPFEAALITRPVVDEMIAKGKIVAGSRVDVGVVRVGVAVRGDAPALDLTSADGLKKAILGAQSIRRFYGVGASVPTLDNLFSKLGLTEITKDKMIALGAGKPMTEAAPAAGQYELIINLASEVIPLKGWHYLGLIPEAYQLPVYLSVGIGTQGDAAAAKKVIAVLETPDFGAALKANGMSRK